MMNLGLLNYLLPEVAEEQEQMIVYSLSADIHSIFGRHMISRNLNFRLYFFILLSVSLSFTARGQKLKGTVVNNETNEPLSYVNIGVEGKNVGIISDDKGEFILDLSKIEADDHIQFSMIGYETVRIKNPKGNQEKLRIKLMPISYDLETIEIIGDKNISTVKLGRYKSTKTTTGQGGIDTYGFGGEWGIKIKYPGVNYYLKDINFHTRFNTVDSVLYRLNVYDMNDDIPGKSKLQHEIFTKSYSKNKWILADVTSHGLEIEDDIIVTFELVRIWYDANGGNHLFYTHGKGYEEGNSYSRESSHDKWSVNLRGPIAMYITGVFEEE